MRIPRDRDGMFGNEGGENWFTDPWTKPAPVPHVDPGYSVREAEALHAAYISRPVALPRIDWDATIAKERAGIDQDSR